MTTASAVRVVWNVIPEFTSENKLKTKWLLSIHPLHWLSYWVVGNLEPVPGDSGQKTPWTGCKSITGHNLTHTHTRQFNDAIQPKTHVFELGEENQRKPLHVL